VHDEMIFLRGKMVYGIYLQSLTICSLSSDFYIFFYFLSFNFYFIVLIVGSEILFFI
jgi:hypothetical protein